MAHLFGMALIYTKSAMEKIIHCTFLYFYKKIIRI